MWSQPISNYSRRNIFALFTILIYSKYLKRSNNTLIDIINMSVVIDEDISDIQINKLIDDLLKKSTELKFISMSRTEHSTSINVELKLITLMIYTNGGEVKKQYPSSKTIIAQNTNYLYDSQKKKE